MYKYIRYIGVGWYGKRLIVGVKKLEASMVKSKNFTMAVKNLVGLSPGIRPKYYLSV